jgi:hypothetical protein
MTRALLAALLLAAACSTTPNVLAIGQFNAPTGVSATGTGDRDIVFIANSGRDSLRALQICNHALLPNGKTAPGDTCPSDQNGQFIPAPIRVFPASIETGERPLRVAGVRLQRADRTPAGVALAAGADTTVAVVDALALLRAQDAPGAQAPHVLLDPFDAGARTVDVIAANPVDPEFDYETAADPGAPVTAFVATETHLIALNVALDANGVAQAPTELGRCALAPVLPTRLAVVPGSDARVYVADGAGDGVVSIEKSSILAGPAGGPCTMDRISAGGRTVRSIALSPRWYEGSITAEDPLVTHVAGEFLLMVLDPKATPEAGNVLDPGGVLFARTGLGAGPKGIVPIPPFNVSVNDPAVPAPEPMQPLSMGGPGLTQEGTFLRAVKPRAIATPPDQTKLCTGAPCTPIYVGQPTNNPVQLFNLVAAVTATDGITYLIDVPQRHFINQNLYALPGEAGLTPTVDLSPVFSPAVTNAPVLAIDFLSLQPGVTHRSLWRTIWHSPIPAFDRRGGILQPSGAGTLTLTLPGTNLDVFRNDPAISLGVGDVVSFAQFVLGSDRSPACQLVVASETAFRFEVPIVAFRDSSTLELAELPPTPDARGFNLGDCTSLGAVAEVRSGGTQPWLVLEGTTVRGRVRPDGTFVARQRRFDYPRLSYSLTTLPIAANDVSFSFAITGTNPGIPLSGFTFSTGTGENLAVIADGIAVAGFATTVYSYTSPRQQNLVFTSITGSNEVLQADPAILFSASDGVVAYR